MAAAVPHPLHRRATRVYDGLGLSDEQKAELYVDAVVPHVPGESEQDAFRLEDNLALRLLKRALGGDDADALSQMGSQYRVMSHG